MKNNIYFIFCVVLCCETINYALLIYDILVKFYFSISPLWLLFFGFMMSKIKAMKPPPLQPFSLMLNCELDTHAGGLNNRNKRITIKQSLLRNKPDIIYLQETKASHIDATFVREVCGSKIVDFLSHYRLSWIL
jgi:hypothetical protein